MDAQKIAELKKIIDEIVSAPTKSDAKPLHNRLKFEVNNLDSQLDYWAYSKLQETVNLAGSALGQVRNKEHWLTHMWQCWSLFESNALRGK